MSVIGAATLGQVADAIGRAHDVEVSAWVLRPGTFERALEAAGDRGARVSVHLESQPFASTQETARRMHEQNLETAATLGRHGVSVDMREERAGTPLHLKAAVVDSTAYLDERNWANGDTAVIWTQRPEDVALVREAFAGRGGSNASFATRKSAALALEADVIERAPDGVPIRFASETFGPCAVADALEARARTGGDVRVLVDGREARGPSGTRDRSELARLREAGAHVRFADRPAKECLAGTEAWAGSANATAANPNTLDWGMRTNEPAIVGAIADEFDRAWQNARNVI